jgi:hypothetical protein
LSAASAVQQMLVNNMLDIWAYTRRRETATTIAPLLFLSLFIVLGYSLRDNSLYFSHYLYITTAVRIAAQTSTNTV